MTTGMYHLISGYLKAKRAKVSVESTQIVTNPGSSVFKSEVTMKKIRIIIKPVRIAITVERIIVFITFKGSNGEYLS